jgi:hypothetical protein
MQLAALVGYEIAVVVFAVVMLASLIGLSLVGLFRSVARARQRELARIRRTSKR